MVTLALVNRLREARRDPAYPLTFSLTRSEIAEAESADLASYTFASPRTTEYTATK